MTAPGAMGHDGGGAGFGGAKIGLVAPKGDNLGLALKLRGDLPGFAKDQHAHTVAPSLWPTPLRPSSGRHQTSFSRYQRTVRSSPTLTVTEGRQPNSSRMRVGSIA